MDSKTGKILVVTGLSALAIGGIALAVSSSKKAAAGGLSVSFTATTTGALDYTFIPIISGGTAPYAYAWDFGDDTTSDEEHPTHIYMAGAYSVKLTVTDSLGATKTLTQSLVATTNPTPTPTPGGAPLSFIASGSGLTYTFTPEINFGTAPYTYQWGFDDKAAAHKNSFIAKPSFTFSAAGYYIVNLLVKDSTGLSEWCEQVLYTSTGTLVPYITIDTIITQADIDIIEASIGRGENLYTSTFLQWAQLALKDNTSIQYEQMAQAYGIPVSQIPELLQRSRVQALIIGTRFALSGQMEYAAQDGVTLTMAQAIADILKEKGIDLYPKDDFNYIAVIPLFQKMGYLGGTKYVVGWLTETAQMQKVKLASPLIYNNAFYPGVVYIGIAGSTWIITASNGKKWTGTFPPIQDWQSFLSQYWSQNGGTGTPTSGDYRSVSPADLMRLIGAMQAYGAEVKAQLADYDAALAIAEAYQRSLNDAIMAENS